MKFTNNWNWHTQHLDGRTFSERLADKIAAGVGSMWFVYLHVLWFGIWILKPVEEYPYGLLTMVVSLEAIFLSSFIMISANRAADRDRCNAEADYRTNLEAKGEIEALQKSIAMLEEQKLDKIIKHLKIK
jgi:uncharacterized membrane protein